MIQSQGGRSNLLGDTEPFRWLGVMIADQGEQNCLHRACSHDLAVKPSALDVWILPS
jgi:hypothetical protein